MKFEKYLKTQLNYDERKIITAQYGITVLQNELSKFALMFLFYLWAGYLLEFLFYILILMPVRIFTGGMHLKSNIGCFIASLTCSLGAIYVLPMIQLPDIFLYALLLLNIIATVYIAPIKNPKRPVKTRERYVNLKKKASFFIIANSLALVLLSLMDLHNYFVIGAWTLSINSLQLVILWLINNRKGENNNDDNKVITK